MKIKHIIQLFIFSIILFYLFVQAKSGGDFSIYLEAAKNLSEGKTCYNEWFLIQKGNYGAYSYSPIFALILIPFTFLPFPWGQFCWLLLNVFFLYRIYKITLSFLDISILTKRAKVWFYVLTSVMILRFILHNFEMIQMTIFLVYSCMESLYLAHKRKIYLASLILSLGITVKLLPLVILPYFLYRKEFKLFFTTILFILILLFLPALIFGWEFNFQLLNDWFKIINPNNQEFLIQQNQLGEGIHSLTGFFAAFFTENTKDFEISSSQMIFKVSANQLFWIVNLSRLFLIALTLYFLRSTDFSFKKSNLNTFWEFSYILCIVPLIFPHQQKYAFFFIFPAVVYCLYCLTITFYSDLWKSFTFKLNSILLTLIFILTALTSDMILGKELSSLTQYYKAITFGTFILIILIFRLNPNKLNREKVII